MHEGLDKLQNDISTLIYEDLSYESLLTFIAEYGSEAFEKGYLYFDEVFYSQNWKTTLNVSEKINILNTLDVCKARYSDNVYIEALFSDSPEIIYWVKSNLPREYSDRHIEDVETY